MDLAKEDLKSLTVKKWKEKIQDRSVSNSDKNPKNRYTNRKTVQKQSVRIILVMYAEFIRLLLLLVELDFFLNIHSKSIEYLKSISTTTVTITICLKYT